MEHLVSVMLLVLCFVGSHCATYSKSSSSLSESSEQDNEGCCTCDKDVFTFAYSWRWLPYEYIENGELKGFSLDVVKAVCAEMDMKCEHTVYFDYNVCWNEAKQAPGLNNNWFMTCVGLLHTKTRDLVYNFVGEFAPEPRAFLYSQHYTTYTTIGSVVDPNNTPKIGFVAAFWLDAECLQKELGFTLSPAQIHVYPSRADMIADLEAGNIDLMFVDAQSLPTDPASMIKKVGDEFIQCAAGGLALGVRTEMVCRFKWFEEGMQKIIDNGVYGGICNTYKPDNPEFACLGD